MSGRPNPFPGLRPFNADEEHLFFGRERQVDTMVDKLAESRFLAVVGASGSGKSSLVNCGLQPALHRGLLAAAGTSWKIAKFRPGRSPMRAMVRALGIDGFLLRDFGGGVSLEDVVDTHLRVSKRGLLELYGKARLPEATNLLIIVDQFEELFRYASLEPNGAAAVSEAVAFVNLLLEPSTQRDLPIFVAMTMRSDFLGDCAQFPNLPEAINKGQYLLPRMTREDRRRAIRGPVGVGGAEISPVLLTRLVNDVGDNPDQLSILQHALNRTWVRWSDPGEGPIELRHYMDTGSMSSALNDHAEESYAELETDRQREICEKLFKAITDTGTDARGIRRPTVLDDICGIADASVAEITEVIEVFRDPDSSFLMPPPPEALEQDTVIDISHESLMRVWRRLIQWTAEEASDAERYRRLARTAALCEQGEAELLAGAELELMLNWRDEIEPNAAWAERYQSGLDEADAFLDKSKVDAEERQRAEVEEQRKGHELERRVEREAAAARRRKFVYGALIFIILGVVGFSSYTLMLKDQLETAVDAEAEARVEAEERAMRLLAAVAAQNEAQTSKVQVELARHELEQADNAGKQKAESALLAAEERVQQSAQQADSKWAAAAVTAAGGHIIQMDQISKSDFFDVRRGTKVTASSGVRSYKLFGEGAPGWDENAVSFFEDGEPANFKHYIEWQTERDVTLGSVQLFAIHDAPISGFQFRRAINNFKLKMKTGGDWKTLTTFSPTLPYGGTAAGRDPGVSLAVCLSIPRGATGRQFRAEFSQAVDILGNYSGPRIVELDGHRKACRVPQQIDRLVQDMGCADQAARRKATHVMTEQYTGTPEAVQAVLQALRPGSFEALSLEARVNLLFYLGDTTEEAWTPDLLAEGRATVDRLRKVNLGKQATGRLDAFDLRLDQVASP